MSVQSEGYRSESFESLEAAVLETQRGRWFLEEYARRQRSAETLAILEILKKLENSVTNSTFLPPPKGVEPAPALKTEQLKFFKQDEEIFVEPTIAAPALSVVNSPPKVDIVPPPEPKGAKLKIQRCLGSAAGCGATFVTGSCAGAANTNSSVLAVTASSGMAGVGKR